MITEQSFPYLSVSACDGDLNDCNCDLDDSNCVLADDYNNPVHGHLMTSVISCDHQGQSILCCNLAPTILMTKYLGTEKVGVGDVHYDSVE